MYRSGIRALDSQAFEGEGFPPGIIEIAGEPDGGKTSLALWFVRTLLKHPDRLAGWVATETLLRPESLAWAGVASSRLFVARQTPDLPGLDTARELVQNGCDLVVVDSVASLLGRYPGQPLAGVLCRQLPELAEVVQERRALVVLTNQERTLLPSRRMQSAGLCRALLQFTTAHIRLRTGEGLYKAGIQTGVRVHFTLIEKGTASEHWGKTGKFNLRFASGLRDLKTVSQETKKEEHGGDP